jgi:hypothetical protein
MSERQRWSLSASKSPSHGIVGWLRAKPRFPRTAGGSPPLHTVSAAMMIQKVGALLIAEPRVREIDLNRVIVYPNSSGAIALSALMIASADL